MTVLLLNRLKELKQFNVYLVSVRKPIDTSIPMREMAVSYTHLTLPTT